VGDGGPVEETLQKRAQERGRHDHDGHGHDAGVDQAARTPAIVTLARELLAGGDVVADGSHVHPL